MSNLVLFLIDEEMNYEKMKYVSRKIVQYCLKNDYGVIFNFLGYSQELIEKLHPKFFFSISDDFFQLNSEFLTTSDIECISNDCGKKKFIERFSFFDDIYKILNNCDIKKSKLLISADGSSNDLENFVVKNKCGSIPEVLYESIITMKDVYAYDFPNMIIDLND